MSKLVEGIMKMLSQMPPPPPPPVLPSFNWRCSCGAHGNTDWVYQGRYDAERLGSRHRLNQDVRERHDIEVYEVER